MITDFTTLFKLLIARDKMAIIITKTTTIMKIEQERWYSSHDKLKNKDRQAHNKCVLK
jgi:hypothetical protein